MIRSVLLKPIVESWDYANGIKISLCFQRMETGGDFGDTEEMLDYRDVLCISEGEDPALVILKLRDLAKRIENNLVRSNI